MIIAMLKKEKLQLDFYARRNADSFEKMSLMMVSQSHNPNAIRKTECRPGFVCP